MSTNVFSNSQNQTEKQNNFFHKNMNLNDLFSLLHLLTVKCGLIALIKQRVKGLATFRLLILQRFYFKNASNTTTTTKNNNNNNKKNVLVQVKCLNSPVFWTVTESLSVMMIIFPSALQVYEPPSDTEIVLPDSSVIMDFTSDDVCLNHSYFKSADSFTSQVRVSLPPAGMVVLSAVSTGLSCTVS